MIHMREKMLQALKAHATGHIKKHTMNVEVYLTNPVGIGEHPDVIDAIHSQVLKIASAEENIQVLQQHFVDQKVI